MQIQSLLQDSQSQLGEANTSHSKEANDLQAEILALQASRPLWTITVMRFLDGFVQ